MEVSSAKIQGALVVTLALGLGACGSSRSGGSLALNLTTKKAASLTMLKESLQTPFDRLSPFTVSQGSNTAAQLQSLKYVFGGISICESVTISGSAFSSPTGCLSIYSGPVVGDGSSSAITPATLSTYADNQIDMMDATSRAKINGTKALTSDDVRSYNYAVINWYTPIAFKGCATIGGSQTVCSQAGSSYSGGSTTTTSTMIGSTAAEAIVVSANGGSFAKFQKPFTITDQDITDQTAFTVDMVFNPDNIIAATDNRNNGNLNGPDASMYLPMLNIAPVPRKGTQKTMRETYLSEAGCNSASDAGSTARYRIDLYYNSDDSTSILGATGTQVVPAGDSGFSIGQTDYGSKMVEVVKADDGTLTLKTPGATASAGNTAFISGLTRGANGSATVNFTPGPGSRTCTFTYTAGVDVNL